MIYLSTLILFLKLRVGQPVIHMKSQQ